MKTITLCILMLAGCSTSTTGDVKHANNETNIRYVICGAGEEQCFVAARFQDLDACESHKRWSEMLCTNTDMGMNCIKNDDSLAKAYCTL